MGFALAPFIGLQVYGSQGDTAMWIAFAVGATVAALLGAFAVREAVGEGPPRGRHANCCT
jgi:hypothetical protein